MSKHFLQPSKGPFLFANPDARLVAFKLYLKSSNDMGGGKIIARERSQREALDEVFLLAVIGCPICWNGVIRNNIVYIAEWRQR
jgi:hypothetical protein